MRFYEFYHVFFEVNTYLKKNEQEEKEESNPQCIQEKLDVRKVINEMSCYLQMRK